MVALSKHLSEVSWVFETPAMSFVESAPALGSDGHVYFGCNDGALYALNTHGSQLWSYSTGGAIKAPPAIMKIAYNAEYVIAGSADGYVYSVLAATGSKRWSFNAKSAVTSAVIVSEDGSRVYLASSGGDVFALDSADGSSVWSYDAQEEIHAPPALNWESVLYITTHSGKLLALDSSTGSLKWSLQVDSKILSSVLVDGNSTHTVYFGTSGGYVYGVSGSGAVEWSYDMGSAIRAAPAISSNGDLFIGNDGGVLFSFQYASSVLPTALPTAAPTSVTYTSTCITTTFKLVMLRSLPPSVLQALLSNIASAVKRTMNYTVSAVVSNTDVNLCTITKHTSRRLADANVAYYMPSEIETEVETTEVPTYLSMTSEPLYTSQLVSSTVSGTSRKLSDSSWSFGWNETTYTTMNFTFSIIVGGKYIEYIMILILDILKHAH
jgi:hypothetical protein